MNAYGMSFDLGNGYSVSIDSDGGITIRQTIGFNLPSGVVRMDNSRATAVVSMLQSLLKEHGIHEMNKMLDLDHRSRSNG